MNKTIQLMACAIMLFCLIPLNAQKDRSEVTEQDTWNVHDLYESDEVWNTAKEKFIEKAAQLETYKGKLGSSPQVLLSFLKLNDEINKEGARLYIYTSLKSDVDVRNQDNQAQKKDIRQAFIALGQKTAFISPEFAAIPEETMKKFIQEEQGLKTYELELMDTYRMKKHTLSEPEELIMAKASMVRGTAKSVYSVFSDAEMPWPKATLSNGTEIEVNKITYAEYRMSPNAKDREIVFNAFWNHYKKFEGTFGELMNGQVKNHMFTAQARHYTNSLEAALKGNNIPTDVYHSLVKNVNKNLPTFHRYLALKKRMMGLDTLKYSDLYAPAVKGVELKYTYEEAQELILAALKPLGKEYISTVDKAFNNRWIDVYPTKGKRSGAYSNGSAYDVHPYILMNYNNNYDDVSTLIHELGHTMHSYFSNTRQPVSLADYPIFLAEVASTFNEVLLANYMKKKIKDEGQKLSLLMNMLDGFKGTLFRQTQFAEFELCMHEAAEAGQPLTGQVLSKMYYDITSRYYGNEEGICKVPQYVEMEWAYIPHFYYNFYVYQYSTSYVASQALAAEVMNGDKKATEKYMNFISSGCSDWAINTLKTAGVDMMSSEPFDSAIENMNKIMDEMEAILDKQ